MTYGRSKEISRCWYRKQARRGASNSSDVILAYCTATALHLEQVLAPEAAQTRG